MIPLSSKLIVRTLATLLSLFVLIVSDLRAQQRPLLSDGHAPRRSGN
jgi:hypothetical protein